MPQVCREDVKKTCRRQNCRRQMALHFHVTFGQIRIGTDPVTNEVIDIPAVKRFVETNPLKSSRGVKRVELRERSGLGKNRHRQTQKNANQKHQTKSREDKSAIGNLRDNLIRRVPCLSPLQGKANEATDCADRAESR